jgi:hypothetical protein
MSCRTMSALAGLTRLYLLPPKPVNHTGRHRYKVNKPLGNFSKFGDYTLKSRN